MFPKVGIIYLTYPTPEWQQDIDRCLTSLASISYPKDRIELICVESKGKLPPVKPWFDQCWMPKSGRELPRITYLLKDEWIGFSGNNNLGFEKVKDLGCEYVYLLNEDTEIDADFLTRAVERAQADSKIAYVQSLILLGSNKNLVNTVGNAYHFLGFGYSNGYLWTRERAERFFVEERKRNPDLEIGYFSGAGVLGRVSIISECGLFDENFFSYHEDTDATLQARVRGYKIVVEPRSVIYHYYEFVKTQLKKNYWVERNRFVLLFSYARWWTWLLLLPMIVVMEFALFAFAIAGDWWGEKWKVYQEWMKPEFWQWVLQRRRAIQRARVIGDRELLRFAVSTIEFQGEGVRNPILTFIGNPLMRVYWRIARQLIV
ncbi:MAG: glycosyltransferase family 2 protein [Candidatus Uhrbacteria bacterium]|nr:glycosyltransferase family 2 protein [Candidatus Uhrbacteria bacterium]